MQEQKFKAPLKVWKPTWKPLTPAQSLWAKKDESERGGGGNKVKPEQLRALLLLLHYSAATAFYLQTLILTASDSTAKLFPVKTQRGLTYPVSPCLSTVREGSLSPPQRAAVNGGLRAELQAPRGSQRGDRRQLLVLQAPRTVFSKAMRGGHLVSPLRHLYTDGTRGGWGQFWASYA